TGLQALDMVEAGSRPGTYRLGWRLLRLGSAVIARLDERQAALPVMERIHERTGETVFLCVRRGDDAVGIERLDGLRVQWLMLRPGGDLGRRHASIRARGDPRRGGRAHHDGRAGDLEGARLHRRLGRSPRQSLADIYAAPPSRRLGRIALLAHDGLAP